MKFKEYQTLTVRTLPDLHELYESRGHNVGVLQYRGTDKAGLTTRTDLHGILNAIHMVLGIAGETAELIEAIERDDKVNIVEELTDKLWYISNDLNLSLQYKFIDQGTYNHFNNWEFPKETTAVIASVTVDQMLLALTHKESLLIDMVKRGMAYGKSSDILKYTDLMTAILSIIGDLGVKLGVDVEIGMERNIEKLKGRFPDKFDSNQAIHRNLEVEREILEGGTIEEPTKDLFVPDGEPILPKTPHEIAIEHMNSQNVVHQEILKAQESQSQGE